MKQPIKTPPIATCARCGADAKCIDWDFRDRWRVMCNNNHTSTNECATKHRAICVWNNAQTKMRNAEARRVDELTALRKQDTELIRQMLDALESVDDAMPVPVARQVLKVARARLEGKPCA